MGILSSGPALSVVNTTLIYRRLHSTRRFPCIQGEKGTAIPVSEEPMTLMSPTLAGVFFPTSATWEAQRLEKEG